MKTKLDTAWTQRDKLHAEGNKLYAEGNKLYAEGDLVFINAVIAQCGKDARIEWTDTGCIVQGVMEFLDETR